MDVDHLYVCLDREYLGKGSAQFKHGMVSADHDLMNPSDLKQYEFMNDSFGMYRAQDDRVIQFGRNLRKLVRRRLLSLQNIAIFYSFWANT